MKNVQIKGKDMAGGRTGMVQAARWKLWAAGIASMVLGVIALIFPFAATVGVELAFGAVLVVAGLVEVVRAFSYHRASNIVWNLLFGVLAVAVGLLMMLYPMAGAVTLTTVLSAFFLVGGVVKIIASLVLRDLTGWGWMALSGVVSAALGILLILGLPGTALWALGVMLGIDLVFLGVAQIALVTRL